MASRGVYLHGIATAGINPAARKTALGSRTTSRYQRVMRRLLPLLFLTLTGCSNAPVAGFLDNCFPSRAKANPDPKPPADVIPPVDPLHPGPVPGPSPAPAPVPPPAGLEP